MINILRLKNKKLKKMGDRSITPENINNQNRSGFTALHLAVIKQDRRLVEILLNLGADLNVQNKLGETPLALAILTNNIDIVKILLKHDAIIDFDNNLDILDYTAMVDNLEMWIMFKKLTETPYYPYELIEKALTYRANAILKYLFKKLSKNHGIPERKMVGYAADLVLRSKV